MVRWKLLSLHSLPLEIGVRNSGVRIYGSVRLAPTFYVPPPCPTHAQRNNEIIYKPCYNYLPSRAQFNCWSCLQRASLFRVNIAMPLLRYCRVYCVLAVCLNYILQMYFVLPIFSDSRSRSKTHIIVFTWFRCGKKHVCSSFKRSVCNKFLFSMLSSWVSSYEPTLFI